MPRAQSDVSWQHQVALEPSACQGGEAGICKSAAALTLHPPFKCLCLLALLKSNRPPTYIQCTCKSAGTLSCPLNLD